jgi:hypothetical protein
VQSSVNVQQLARQRSCARTLPSCAAETTVHLRKTPLNQPAHPGWTLDYWPRNHFPLEQHLVPGGFPVEEPTTRVPQRLSLLSRAHLDGCR